MSAFAQLELSREFIIEDEGDLLDPADTRLTSEQAYVTFAEILPGLSMQIARQMFEDERDWWYKGGLDAVRLFCRTKRLGLEFSASRVELLGDDLLNRHDPEQTNNFSSIGRYANREDSEFDVHVFK